MYIKVRVIAGAKSERVLKETKDHFVISVKEKAKGNAANRRVLEIISEIHGGEKVRIISGHHSPGKLLSVDC